MYFSSHFVFSTVIESTFVLPLLQNSRVSPEPLWVSSCSLHSGTQTGWWVQHIMPLRTNFLSTHSLPTTVHSTTLSSLLFLVNIKSCVTCVTLVQGWGAVWIPLNSLTTKLKSWNKTKEVTSGICYQWFNLMCMLKLCYCSLHLSWFPLNEEISCTVSAMPS